MSNFCLNCGIAIGGGQDIEEFCSPKCESNFYPDICPHLHCPNGPTAPDAVCELGLGYCCRECHHEHNTVRYIDPNTVPF